MINVSFLEKIKCFINIMNNNASSIILFVVLILLTIALLITYKKNSKAVKISFVVIYILIAISTIVIFREQIWMLFDYLIENIIKNLLFPNLAVYMAILLIINVIVLLSIFSNKMKYYVKSINIVCFSISQLFLYLIVKNIITNNINVYEKLSIYTNQELLVLVELSMHLFVVWICVLMIIRAVDYLIVKSEKNNIVDENDLINDEISVEFDNSDLSYDDEFIEYVPIKKKEYM